MHPSLWSWPQWIAVALYALSIFGASVLHGRPKGDYSAGATVFSAAAGFALLWWGGFFP